ncbi:MAG: DNA polymerase III subunit gamma/tau [Patescibacteria group bacterium]|jgi:DNA polymerase-3 subunit gamma/tau|nr:DNA polymerase III subunit gamma/tau [Patescibacteria group bacterium]
MSTLYRKYRPIKFSETTGQRHVVRTLSNAIKNKRIGSAFLFTGPRGIGKTTLARIFSKTVNCLDPQPSEEKEISIEPCNKCENCKKIAENKAMDLIEIDAASHTGVDNIRQLKESVNVPPIGLKYKIYIIDEVHMLSIGAFNALLKTLEEPPEHAIFILATTELHKVPETIISRCQRFDLHRLTQIQIIERLKQIAKNEKVEIEIEALENIALESEGGMRDAESILGQIISFEDKKITAQEVSQILGTSSRKNVIDFLIKITEDKTEDAIDLINKFQNEGFNLRNFNKQLLVLLRSCLIAKIISKNFLKIITNLTKEQAEIITSIAQKNELSSLIKLTEIFRQSLLQFKETSIPQLPLEMAIIEYSLLNNNSVEIHSEIQNKETSKKNYPEKKIIPQKENESPKTTKSKIEASIEASIETSTDKVPSSKDTVNGDLNQKKETDIPSGPIKTPIGKIIEKWSDLIEAVKPANHSIHAFLKNCVPAGIIENKLYIKTKYDFYKDKLNEANNKLTVQEALVKITEEKIQIFVITEKEAEGMKFNEKKEEPGEENVLHDAMQMIGGKIV